MGYKKVHIDFETRSAIDLKKAGSDIYSAHPSTDILCLAYAFDDEPPQLWTPQMSLGPQDLLEFVAFGGQVFAYNMGGFEFLLWNNHCTLRYGWPDLGLHQVVDPMAMTYAMSLPGDLDGASRALAVGVTKDLKGHRIMLQLSQPKNDTGDFYEYHQCPEKFEKLYEYCKQDVIVERALTSRLLELTKKEREVWELDHKINRRGVYVDIPVSFRAIELVEREKERLDLEIKSISKNAIGTCSAVGQIVDYLKLRGIEVPSIAKAEVTSLLDREDLPEDCREILELRKEAAKTSTAKILSMISGAANDHRVRGLFQYHGASTGRWAGRRVQLQNLPRPVLSQEEILNVFALLNSGKSSDEILQHISMFYGNPLGVISDCIRGLLRAEPGNKLIGCDFSAIEARVLAWLAGEDRVLDIFRGDGKIYEFAAAQIYKNKIDEVTKSQRQIGKVAVLALGYGGGVGAFQTMARGYGVKISDTEAETIKTNWRGSNKNIVNYWLELEENAQYAVKNPLKKVSLGPKDRQISFLVNGSFLFMRLPSGRVLTYPHPLLQKAEMPWGEIKDQLTYMGIDTYTKKWERIKTYGGKLCENVTQAVARDLLSESLLRLENRNHPVVMHVHDECVVEVPSNFSSDKEVEKICEELPTWAGGLPMKSEAWEGERYQK